MLRVMRDIPGSVVFWLLFFLSPFFWPYVHDVGTAFALLACSTGLAAAASMSGFSEVKFIQVGKWAWLGLAGVLLPGALLVLSGQARNSSALWQQSLFLGAAWLVFAYARGRADELLGSRGWVVLMAVVGHLYVVYAVMQWADVRPLSEQLEGSLFPFWTRSWQARHFAGPLAQPNLQGLFLCLVVMAMCSRFCADTSDRWWFWWMLAVLPLMNMLATASRASVLVFGVGAALVIWAAPQRKRALLRVLSCLAVAAVACWILLELKPASHPGDTPDIVERIRQHATIDRLFIWDMCVRLALQHPWLGVGLGNLPAYSADAQLLTLAAHPQWADSALVQAQTWAHNIVIQFAVECGVPGLVAVLALCIATLFRTGVVLKQSSVMLGGVFQGCLGFGLILLHGMVSVSVFNSFFLVLGGLYAAAAFPRNRGNDV